MKELMHVEHGFGPVWNASSRVMLLGSMPSPKSRDAGFYYMNPRNRFWPVMQALYPQHGSAAPLTASTIEERRDFLFQRHIALWDVLQSCDIVGASDASIRNPVPTDLSLVLSQSAIRHIVTTGAKAAMLFRKYSQPLLEGSGMTITMTALPSTSPANAAMHLPDLIERYRIITEYTDEFAI
jgi:hypoxanthine-DNA glycosylase